MDLTVVLQAAAGVNPQAVRQAAAGATPRGLPPSAAGVASQVALEDAPEVVEVVGVGVVEVVEAAGHPVSGAMSNLLNVRLVGEIGTRGQDITNIPTSKIVHGVMAWAKRPCLIVIDAKPPGSIGTHVCRVSDVKGEDSCVMTLPGRATNVTARGN